MSPESKPNYRVVYRTHYRLRDENAVIDEKKADIAKKYITEKYKNFGISLNWMKWLSLDNYEN